MGEVEEKIENGFSCNDVGRKADGTAEEMNLRYENTSTAIHGMRLCMSVTVLFSASLTLSQDFHISSSILNHNTNYA